MERETLIHLVTAVQSGDGDALDKLLSAFYKDVFYFALKTVKDEELAADITQETFATVITTIEDLKEPAAFVKWMKQITYHHCTHYFSKKKEILVDEDEEGNTVFDVVAEDRTEFIPDEALDQQDFRKTILSILDELPDEQRAAVLMYYYDELSVKQIAEIQGVSEGTVKSRLNYARKAVKNSVETYEKKHNIRLHTFAFLPFMFWLFKKDAEESVSAADAAAPAVAEGVSAATGTQLSLGGAVTGSAGAVTAAATISGTGLLGKLASIPLVVKILAGVVAAIVALGGLGILLHNGDSADQPTATNQPSSTNSEDSTPSVFIVPEGCTYITKEAEYSAGQTVPRAAAEGDVLATLVYTYTCDEDPYGQIGWKVNTNNKELVEYPELLSEINGLNLISMAGAFMNCAAMEKAPTIPECVTSLVQAFWGCESLQKMPQIPYGVTNLQATFVECSNLTSVTEIPLTVTNMLMTFAGCASLTEAPSIPDSVINLDGTFRNCTNLITVPYIGSSVQDMEEAFLNCTSLTTVPTIPYSVENLRYTFYGCSSLAGTITIDANLAQYIRCTDCWDCTVNEGENPGSWCSQCSECTAYYQCFASTQAPIKLAGSCAMLEELVSTATNENVNIG